MTNLLVRICLALTLAFVFTGRMEAAAAHCAKLVGAEAVAPAPEAMPCHGMDEAAAADATSHPSPAPQAPADTCECVAVLKACSAVAGAPASSRVEPYEWMRPEAAGFASIEPAPALKPPRA